MGGCARGPRRRRSQHGRHRPLGALAILGLDAYDSYGYPGGLNQQIINPMNCTEDRCDSRSMR